MELATGTVFLAGLATFASPCVLPMIPIYLSVLMGGSVTAAEATGLARLRLLVNGFMFVLGFSLVFVLMGLTATALGAFLLEHRLLLQQLGGLVVFLFGLKFLGWLRIEALEREKRFQLSQSRGMSPWGALLMGFTFAFGWTPCVGPVLGAILTYTVVSTSSLGDGAWNLFVYSAGIALPLLIVAALAQSGVRLLNRVKRFIPRIEKATGAVLIAMAVLMVTDSTSILSLGIGDDSSAAISQQVVADTRASGSGVSPPITASEPAAAVAATTAGAALTCDEETSDSCGIAYDGDEAGAPTPAAEVAPGTQGRVVYFHQPSCPSCLRLTPVIEAMQHTCSGRGLAVERVDVSQRHNRARAASNGVRGTPTLVFQDEHGSEVARLVGAQSIDSIHEAVAVLMGDQCADFTTI